MAIKFDVKQFLLQKGERVGLYVAAGLGALLLLLGLKSALGSSAGYNEQQLKAAISSAQSRMARTPSTDEAAEISRVDPKLDRSVKFDSVRVDPFAETLAFFQPFLDDDTKRRAPKLLLPDEFKTAVARAQARSYILSSDRSKIMVLVGAGGEKGSSAMQRAGGALVRGGRMGMGGPGGSGMGPPGGSGGGPPGGSGGGPPGGSGGGSGGGPPGGGEGRYGQMSGFRPPMGGSEMMGAGLGGAGGTAKGEAKMVKVDELDSLSDARLAEDILPLRMAIIVGTFPYKQQLEEYRKALRFDNVESLLGAGLEPQFAGFEVERAEVRADQPEPQWKPLDLKKTFGPVAVITGMPDRSEEEDPRLESVIFPNLVMKRPIQFRKGQYPKPEDKLKAIDDTLAKLKETSQGQIIKPKNRFKDLDNIDIFGGGSTDTSGNEASNPMPPAAGTKSRNTPMPPTAGGEGSGTTGQTVIQEHILLRILDVTIQPGTSYKYRFRVRLQNPNYKQANVAWASLAADKELKTDWVYVPDVVRVPPELYYYAYDLKTQGDRDDKRRLWQAPNPSANQIVVQIHHWLENFATGKMSYSTVGDWVVAERWLLGRGEYVGATVMTDVPVWDVRDDRFTLAVSSAGNRRTKQVPVFFGIGQENGPWVPILVDFNGGELRYDRYAGTDEDTQKAKYNRVTDKAPFEVIIMSPEGKLAVRNADNDAKDDTRTERYNGWKERIDEVKQKDKAPSKGSQPPGTNPFGS
jgi:hypothetical protein